MLLQVKKDKSGVSIVIGYVLLISISIVMSIVVFQWLRTYVPTEGLECDEGTSIFVREIYYNSTAGRLDITVKNNGKFSVDGYFIRVSDNIDEEQIATIDISSKIEAGGNFLGNSIKFSNEDNFLTPDEPHNEILSSFDVSSYETLYKVEIVPIRIQEIEGRKRLVSCTNAKIEQPIVESTA